MSKKKHEDKMIQGDMNIKEFKKIMELFNE